jgi:hypothetical protein
MKGNKSKEHKPENREDVFQRAFGEMCKSLDRYGPAEILRILTENSRNDTICRDLLFRFPTTVALGNFLSTLPVIKVNKRTLKRIQKRGCLL